MKKHVKKGKKTERKIIAPVHDLDEEIEAEEAAEDYCCTENPAVPDEEVAYRLVKLYFEEVARLGFKRRLDLDAIINAYLYALRRLESKKKEMNEISKFVEKEEQHLGEETKEEAIPGDAHGDHDEHGHEGH